MSAASTAAAIGLQIGADDKQAIKALADLVKNLDVLEAKATTVSGELRDVTVDGLEKVTFGVGRAAVSTAKWGLGLGALSATAATVGLIDMAKDFATGAATMGRSADRLGMPVDKLSQFGIAAHLAGSSAEAMQAGLQGLQATTADAAYGRNNEAWQAFRSAGIDVGDAKRGVVDDPGRMSKIADETQRLAKVSSNAAQRWLDMIGVGRELYPVLRNGSAGLQGYMDQAKSFHLTTPKDVQEARELEMVMAGLGERFSSFARIGGAAVAPGLTHFLDTLGKYLAEHQGDVTTFFDDVEHGIEWLTTPKNMAWLKRELDDATDGVKELYHWAQEMEHSPLVRRLLGLPQEPGATEGGPSVGHGIPTEDDGGALEGAIAGAHGPNLFQRLFPSIFGSGKGNGGSGASAGHLLPQLQSESDQAADAMGVPRAFAQAIFGTEGGLNSDGSARTSSAGAVGAGQLMPGTAAMYGVHDSRDLHQNVVGSVAYMRKLLNQFHGNEAAAAAAYNAGENNAGVQLFARTGVTAGLPAETRQYIQDVARREAATGEAAAPPSPQNATPTAQHPAIPAVSQLDPAPFAMPSDPGTQRMAADARAGTATNTSDATAAASAEARLSRLRVEIHHTNAPPGTSVQVSHDSPGFIDVDGPRTMGAMPTTGTQRDVVRDGY